MKRILPELYNGNYSAIGRRIPRDSKYARALHALCDMEEKINACLTDEQRAVFREYLDAQEEFVGEGSEMYFIEGCRLGAKLMLEMISEA